jgi:hypothetical protein
MSAGSFHFRCSRSISGRLRSSLTKPRRGSDPQGSLRKSQPQNPKAPNVSVVGGEVHIFGKDQKSRDEGVKYVT